MEQHYVKIKSVENVTHNVLRLTTDKPSQYTFTPGQATEIAINKDGWQNEKKFSKKIRKTPIFSENFFILPALFKIIRERALSARARKFWGFDNRKS